MTRGAGTPVVFLHGLASCHYTWRHAAHAVAAHGFKAVVVDLPGHGFSSDPSRDEANLAGTLAALRRVLGNMGIGKAHFVGHSMGGAIAEAYLRAYPGDVGRLVLVASSDLNIGIEVDDTVARNILLFSYHHKKNITREWLSLLEQFKHRAPCAEIGHPERPVTGEPLDTPCMIAWGAEDLVLKHGTERAAVIARRFRDHQIRVFEQAGHACHEDQADAFNAALVSFLAEST